MALDAGSNLRIAIQDLEALKPTVGRRPEEKWISWITRGYIEKKKKIKLTGDEHFPRKLRH